MYNLDIFCLFIVCILGPYKVFKQFSTTNNSDKPASGNISQYLVTTTKKEKENFDKKYFYSSNTAFREADISKR